jgi:hypothetical protein
MMRQKQRRRTGTRTKNKVCLWNKVVCVAAGDLAREMLKPKVDAGGAARPLYLRPRGGAGGGAPRLSTVLLEDWLRSLLSVLLLVLLLPPPDLR